MPDAFIYDAVRTPRGRGKPDGSLHEVSSLGLAVTALQAIRDRNKLEGARNRRRHPRLRRSGRGGRRRHRPRRGDFIGLFLQSARRADQPLLRVRTGLGEFRRRRDHVRPARPCDRRRRREHEPCRHRRVGRRLAGRSDDRHSLLFHAAGRVGRSHRHQIRLLARRRRRLRGRNRKSARRRPGKKAASNIRSCR